MKTRQSNTAKAGGHVGVFKDLIRPDNKVGLRKTKAGDSRMMFRIQVGKGKDDVVPCSVVWDFDDPKFQAVAGALAVPADTVKKAYLKTGKSVTKTLIWFEGMAKKKASKVSVYVREDGGFGSGLKPVIKESEDMYAVVAGFKHDRDTNKATWVIKEEVSGISKRTKKPYTIPGGKKFSVYFKVVSGPNRGSSFTKSDVLYAIVKDEDDEWIVDADGRGREFKSLMTLHKIDTDSIDPDRDFSDPENGLPELEKKVLKRPSPLIITVNQGGWVTIFKAAPKGTVIEGVPNEPVDTSSKEYEADNGLVAKMFSMIDRRVKKDSGKSAWLDAGRLSLSGKSWLKGNKLPTKFESLTDGQVRKIILMMKRDHPV